MRAWVLLFGGLLVWAADFFLLYGIASILLTTPAARIASAVVTLAAIAADLWLMWRSWNAYRAPSDEYEGWLAWMALLMAGISLVSVIWQGFPAIFISSD